MPDMMTEDSTQTPPENQRLVLCFDGTGNQFRGDRSDTNVVKIFSMLARDSDNQYHYYQPGIGTYVLGPVSKTRDTLKNGTEKILDQMWGISFSDHVIAGYVFVMRYYSPGDDIYMFGFSRGAYTARFLAEMIDHVGLLSKGNEEMVGFAWRTYEQYMRAKTDKERDEKRRFMQKFKSTFSRKQCEIKFLGLFDCVNSTALFRDQFRPMIRPPARHIRHAVSIDEKRCKFRASLFDLDPRVRGQWESNYAYDCTIKEQWFAGNHCNIGGGNRTDLTEEAKYDPILSDIALSWMMKEVLGIHNLFPVQSNSKALNWDSWSVVELLNLMPDPELEAVKSDSKWFVTATQKDLEDGNQNTPIADVVKECILAREADPYFYLNEKEVRFNRGHFEKQAKNKDSKEEVDALIEKARQRRKQQMMVDDLLSYKRNLFTDPSLAWYSPKRFFSVWKARHLTFCWNLMEYMFLARIELSKKHIDFSNENVKKLTKFMAESGFTPKPTEIQECASEESDEERAKKLEEKERRWKAIKEWLEEPEHKNPYEKWITEYWPNCGSSRDLYRRANLHHSVVQRMIDQHKAGWEYRPHNDNFNQALESYIFRSSPRTGRMSTKKAPPPKAALQELPVLKENERKFLAAYRPKEHGEKHRTTLEKIGSVICFPYTLISKLWRHPTKDGYHLLRESTGVDFAVPSAE